MLKIAQALFLSSAMVLFASLFFIPLAMANNHIEGVKVFTLGAVLTLPVFLCTAWSLE